LLNESLVASVPGSTYGVTPFFRISTATAAPLLSEALDRIAMGINRLRLNA